MKNSVEQIEQLLKKADFSKETDLKQRLDKQLFGVRKVTLDELMVQEGLGSEKSQDRKRNRSKSAVSVREKTKDNKTKQHDIPHKTM